MYLPAAAPATKATVTVLVRDMDENCTDAGYRLGRLTEEPAIDVTVKETVSAEGGKASRDTVNAVALTEFTSTVFIEEETNTVRQHDVVTTARVLKISLSGSTAPYTV